MKWPLLLLLLFNFASCASKRADEAPSVIITEINPNKWTYLTKQNMLQLAQVYDLSPFLYTKKIQVQSNVSSSAFPVLTLSTKYSEEPKNILSMWLREEFHWWARQNKINADLAVKELKKIYPRVPTPRGSHSIHLHLIVCYLEFKALEHYLGPKEARNVTQQIMKKDKLYSWVYYQILYKNFAIKKTIEKYQLLPQPLS